MTRANTIRKPCSFKQSKKLWREGKKFLAFGGGRGPMFPDYPTYIKHAKGCRMWDVDNNEFIDLLCSFGPIILGYAYKPVDDAARAIIKNSFQSSMVHPVQVDAARMLVEMIPCAERVQFFKTGSTATMAAARFARNVTGRTYIARCGYHGWADLWQRGEKSGTHKAAWEVVLPFDGTAEGLAKLFKKHSRKKFAAVFLCTDTIGSPFTTENFQGIVDLAHKNGALAVFDEIRTGFRVAPGGAQEHLSVTPDLTTVSKGIANGYPLAAVVGKARYMEHSQTPTGGTFLSEGLALTAAVATMKELKTKRVVSHLWKVGQRMIDGLNAICDNHGMDEARCFPDPVASMPRFCWKKGNKVDTSHRQHQYFFSQCMRYGLFFHSAHVAFMNYSHKNRDIDEVLDICDFVMAKTKKQRR